MATLVMKPIERNAKVYCVTTAKGGTGKSTLLLHLADGLTENGKRVLIIDTDAQANTTHYFGKTKGTLYDSIKNETPLIIERTENPLLDVVTADMRLADADYSLRKAIGSERVLKDLIEPIRNSYDIVLIDTAPNIGMLTMNSMYCADHIIIPCVAEPFSVEGLQLTLEIKKRIEEKVRNQVIPFNIVITRRRNIRLQDLEEKAIRDAYGDAVLVDVMHEKAVYAEKSCGGKTKLNYEMKYMPLALGMLK